MEDLRAERDRLKSLRLCAEVRLKALRKQLTAKHGSKSAALPSVEFLEEQSKIDAEIDRTDMALAATTAKIELVESIIKPWIEAGR